MSISKEVIAGIVNFHPREAARKGGAIDLGEIEKGITVVYDLFTYQRRVVVLPGEPLILAWTRQPVVALVEGCRVTPLPYATDVEGLGESLAVKVADCLGIIRTRQERN